MITVAISRPIAVMALLGVAATSALSRATDAQTATLRGIVADSARQPIKDVDIGFIAQKRLVRTDDAGRFVMAELPVGPVEISVRRLGYKPQKLTVDVKEPTDTLHIALASEPALLQGMQVSASQKRLRHGIEEFYRRRVKGVGTYWSREEIAAYNTERTSDVMRAAPGIRFVRVPGGMGVRFNSTSIVRRDCIPMIWLDGQRAPGMEVDDVPASHIEGIELYSGPSTTPVQFSQYSSSSTCGTIAIWTRIPGQR